MFFITLGILFACTPYDSNAANKRLLQGDWILYGVELEGNDIFNTVNDTIIVGFVKDSVYDFHVNKQIIYSFSFDISNYELMICRNDSVISRRDILALSEDSLIIGNKDFKYKYRKFETNYK